MAKFKVGDKVRVVWANPSDWYDAGTEGVVEDVFNTVYIVSLANGNSWYVGEERLELIEADMKNWWETPEGIEWLSAQQDIEEQFLKSQEKEEENTYHVGQRFLVAPPSGAAKWYCLLAQVRSHMVCFIDLESGNRINEPVSVRDVRKITEDEMRMIAEDCSFRLL